MSYEGSLLLPKIVEDILKYTKRPQLIFQIFFLEFGMPRLLIYFRWPSNVKLEWVLDWTVIGHRDPKMKKIHFKFLTLRHDLETSPKVGQFKVNQIQKINIWFYSRGLFTVFHFSRNLQGNHGQILSLSDYGPLLHPTFKNLAIVLKVAKGWTNIMNIIWI